tara:strand:- start:1423 stop:1797 length:375 start_codon:yes stop_codon:yes gene_type:complete
MITDELKKQLVSHLKSIITSAKIGLGGNSTNPISTDLDVPLSVSPTLVKTESDLNVLEIKVSVAGSSIQGQVIREVGLFDDNTLSAHASRSPRVDYSLFRTNFDGVGPFSTTETLELFILLEVE